MTLDCKKAQDLLAEESVSEDLLKHVSQCHSCSSLASGLSMLDAQVNAAPRYNPPRDLNELILFKLEAKQREELNQSPSTEGRNKSWIQVTCLALAVTTCISLLDLIRIDH